jgi:hypothetical protein
MSDQQQQPPYNPNPYQPQQGYAPNGTPQQQPQQGYPQGQPQQGYPQGQPQQGYPQGQPQQQYPQGWAPQGQQMAPQYGYHPPGFAPRHKLPGGAMAASIIWIIYGSLQLIGVVAGLGMGGRPGPSTIIGLGIGVAFLIAGIQTSSGKAKGLLANGICSIILGALIALALLALGSMARGLGGAGGIIVLIGLVFGGMLVTAGILACVSNKNYKEFHHTKFGAF